MMRSRKALPRIEGSRTIISRFTLLENVTSLTSETFLQNRFLWIIQAPMVKNERFDVGGVRIKKEMAPV
ncbi:hypothetical protein TNCT_588091 [Trichonephila clavata]|uniref:Uncharacterized protein n=1 Tax=Trichonephila clavata TaxID=2740835 RepID=A0A8X6IVT0_TRICU|nr:hypothetical protein TNCT_588091 [Trichonephila clavata]